jgi:hypothetical protein
MADHMRGLDLPVGEWIELRGVTDTAALVRAIDAAMPRGATLNVMYPVDDNVEAFLRSHGGERSRPAARDYHIPIDGSTVAEFAAAVARCRPDEVCAHIFVYYEDHSLLEAMDRDADGTLVRLDGTLAPSDVARFREALVGAATIAPPFAVQRHDRTVRPTLRTSQGD